MAGTPASAGTAAQTKVKRQKQFVAVGSVLLLGLIGFQLPKLMGGGGATQTAPPPVTAVGPSSPSAPSAATPGATLPDTDRVVIQPGSGQLVSFGLFKSKDPFVQQLSTNPAAAAPTPAATSPLTPVTTTSEPHTPPRRTAPNGGLTPVTTTSSQTPGSTVPFPSTLPLTTVPAVTTPVQTTPVQTTPVSTTPVVGPALTTTTTPVVAPTAVSISTNGICQVVAVNGTFPAQENIFRVVSIAKDGKSAKIAVVGGAYDSGAASVTLTTSQKLTLVNTADGTRYVLQLKTQCDVQTQPAVGSGTTTTPTVPTSTVAPPASVPLVTTPIVTDALDTTTPTVG